MVVETVTVEAVHFKIRAVEVKWPEGHQIVIGGRLVSSTLGKDTKPYPDLPEYTPELFPVDLSDWIDGKYPEVAVSVLQDSGKMKQCGDVRACTLLFNSRERQTVTDWIRSQK